MVQIQIILSIFCCVIELWVLWDSDYIEEAKSMLNLNLSLNVLIEILSVRQRDNIWRHGRNAALISNRGDYSIVFPSGRCYNCHGFKGKLAT